MVEEKDVSQFGASEAWWRLDLMDKKFTVRIDSDAYDALLETFNAHAGLQQEAGKRWASLEEFNTKYLLRQMKRELGLYREAGSWRLAAPASGKCDWKEWDDEVEPNSFGWDIWLSEQMLSEFIYVAEQIMPTSKYPEHHLARLALTEAVKENSPQHLDEWIDLVIPQNDTAL